VKGMVVNVGEDDVASHLRVLYLLFCDEGVTGGEVVETFIRKIVEGRGGNGIDCRRDWGDQYNGGRFWEVLVEQASNRFRGGDWMCDRIGVDGA
jgi:hypothetical protein